jgi:hypothetical protein
MTDKAPLEVEIKFDGEDMFVVVGGVKIAKRGHPGTRHAKTWVSLEPGYTVRDCNDGREIGIEFKGARVRIH